MGEALQKSLRQEFAQWMESELGYAVARTNVRVDGPSKEIANVIDVRGERWSVGAQRLQSSGLALFGTAVILENVVPLREAIFVSPNVLLVVSVVLLSAAWVAKKRTREYAWVQCSSKKKPLVSGDVQNIRDAVDAFRNHGTARWVPTEVILVSSTAGFEPDAVERARVRGIRCYRRADVGFERLD